MTIDEDECRYLEDLRHDDGMETFVQKRSTGHYQTCEISGTRVRQRWERAMTGAPGKIPTIHWNGKENTENDI